MVYPQTPREEHLTHKKRTEVTTESLTFTMRTTAKMGSRTQNKSYRKNRNPMISLRKRNS